VSSNYSDAWRNFGILWVYVIFNIFGALFLYWLIRVPKVKKEKAEEISVGAHVGAVEKEMGGVSGGEGSEHHIGDGVVRDEEVAREHPTEKTVA
jgi:hypothetical protein